MLINLAFRNIWRNKRRTLITMAAVVFAVFLSSVLRSFQKGAWDNVFDKSINLFFGYVQIHQNGFWDDQSIDNSFAVNDELDQSLLDIDNILGYARRMESFALASSEDLTHGVAVIGIEPTAENDLTELQGKIQEGTYFGNGGCIVASGVATKLNLTVGDTIVLLSQGYHGANAVGKYPIDGIFRYALPDLNKTLVYLTLPDAQEFFAAEDRLTSIALRIDKASHVSGIVNKLKDQLDTDAYEIMDYKELMPELMQARKLDEGSGYITIGILYALISFAIFGTIIMMTQERQYEFGILTSIGMSRWNLFLVTFLETIFIAIAGVVVGILVALPVVYYLNKNPLDLSVMGEDATAAFENFGMEAIVPTSFTADVFLIQALIVLIITIFLGIFPLYRIMKLNPVSAMRA